MQHISQKNGSGTINVPISRRVAPLGRKHGKLGFVHFDPWPKISRGYIQLVCHLIMIFYIFYAIVSSHQQQLHLDLRVWLDNFAMQIQGLNKRRKIGDIFGKWASKWFNLYNPKILNQEKSERFLILIYHGKKIILVTSGNDVRN